MLIVSHAVAQCCNFVRGISGALCRRSGRKAVGILSVSSYFFGWTR